MILLLSTVYYIVQYPIILVPATVSNDFTLHSFHSSSPILLLHSRVSNDFTTFLNIHHNLEYPMILVSSSVSNDFTTF